MKGQRASGRETPGASIAAPSISDLQKQVGALTRELKEAREQQSAVSDLLRAMSTAPGEIQPVLDAVAENAARLCEANNAVIYRLEGDRLKHVASHGGVPTTSHPREGNPANRDTVSGRAVCDRQTIHVRDLAAEDKEYPEGSKHARRDGHRTTLATPLLSEGVPVGSILIRRMEIRPFSSNQVALLETFAHQAVIAIESARLLTETRKTLEQQTATAEVLQVINSSPGHLEPVFAAMLEKATQLCEAAFGILWLCDGEQFQAGALHGVPAAYAEIARKPIHPRPTNPLGRMLRGERVIVSADVADEEPYRAGDPVRGALVDLAGARSVIQVALLKDDVLLGSLTVYRQEVRPFSEKQIALLQNFAAQAVIAMENARLLNQLRQSLQQQTATSEVLQIINSSPGELAPVFDAILERAMWLCEAAFGGLWIFEGDSYIAAALRGVPPAYASYLGQTKLAPGPRTAPYRFLQGERSAIQNIDLAAEEPYLAGDPQRRALVDLGGARTALQVPLVRDEMVLGVITVYRQEVRPFSEKQVTLLQNFAAQAVIAMDNARLFNETKEALARQTATADVLKVIASSPSNLQPVFDAIAERSKALIGAHSATVVRYVDGMIKLAAFTPVSPDADAALLALFPRRATAEHEGVLRGQVDKIRDAESELQGNAMLEAARARGWRSRLHVPLEDETGVIGWISITRKQAGGFADKDIELLQTFADQAVIAIQNVGLFEEVQARTRELAKSLDDLRATQDRLVQTEKLASLGQLTAGIAHEIKNPLNFVNNFSAMSAELLDELDETLAPAPLDPKMRGDVGELTQMLKSNLEKVVQHGKRADSIVKNMLLHSREGSRERRSASINGLVEESLNLAYHGARAEKAGFNITLKHDLDPDAGAVDVYPQEITRALLNLISNGFYAAIKRKAETGDEAFEPELSAATKNLGEAVEIRIRDNGTGIRPEVREKMFNPFFTTKPTGEGTGLGLSMSHDIIVKQHGGSIDVETEPGFFSEFKIVLPRTNQR